MKYSIEKLGLNQNGLVIGHLNIQGLNSKHDELRVLMQSNKIDIFGITETKLSDSHLTEAFSITGFHPPFRRDRDENRGGGILIYVRECINCVRRKDLESSELEHIWVEIKQPNSKSFLLCVLYRNPDARVCWKEIFENNVEEAQFDDKEVLLIGDFNRDLKNDQIHREWINFTSSLGLTQMINTPTREFNNSQTIIDHMYSDNPQNIIWTSVPKIGLSDHYPIFCSRKINFKINKSNHHYITYRSFKTFNEENFLSDLNNVDWNILLDCSDVNETLQSFIETFLAVVDKHVPLRKHRIKRQHQPEWLNEEIIDAMRDRDKFKARNDMCNFRIFRNKVSYLINAAKKATYEKKIIQGQNNPSSIWNIFKE